MVTVEIGGRIFTEIDPCYTRNDPESLLDQVVRKLRAQGFETNSGKLFSGKFVKSDPVKGLELEWKHSSHYIQEQAEKLAREELMRNSWEDEMDSYCSKETGRVNFWFWHESWKGYERCLVPKTVKHVQGLEVRTSPRILNDWFTQLEPFVTQ